MSIWFLAICVAAFVIPYALVAFAIKQEESDNDQFNIWPSGHYLYNLNFSIGEKLMSLFNTPESKADLQNWIASTNGPMATIAAGMTEQFLLSKCEFNKLIPTISASFLTESLPSNFNELECYDIYEFIEEHMEEDFEHMLPESIFEMIENIASNIHYKIRSAK